MTTIFKVLFLVSNTSLRNAESGNRTAYPLSDLRLVPEGQQVDVGLQRAGVDHRLVPETHDIVRRHLRLFYECHPYPRTFITTNDTLRLIAIRHDISGCDVLPLFIERASKGDVLLHSGIEQPGLLGSVGHGVSVLAAVHHGKRRQTEASELQVLSSYILREQED